MSLAILCSGQGPQHPGMFALTGDAPQAAGLFTRAATLLGGRDAREMVRSADAGALHQNRTGQILCTLQALAAAAALRAAWPRKLAIAGYGVGEVPAWSIAGLVEATAALDLVACRAQAMDAASPPGDGLLFVRGLSRGVVDGLCERHEAAVAIVNPGDAFVVGGAGVALDALAEEARRQGATRVVRVAVNVASHTPRLAAASVAFRKALSNVALRRAPDPGVRLFSGIDGAPVFDSAAGADKLAAQISRTVRWADCVESCVEAGATAFLEFGPGRALSEMAAGAYPGLPCRSLEDFRTLRGAREWLEKWSG